MDKIEAITFLINYFKNNPNKTKCCFRQLNKIKYKIEAYHSTVYIDISKVSILKCVSIYSHIFDIDLHKNIIYKKENTEKYFKQPYLKYFNDDIPNYILKEIK